jgi:hypothetical protein
VGQRLCEGSHMGRFLRDSAERNVKYSVARQE